MIHYIFQRRKHSKGSIINDRNEKVKIISMCGDGVLIAKDSIIETQNITNKATEDDKRDI